MKDFKTFDQFWNDLKDENENLRLTLETTDKNIEIINQIINARKNLNMSQRELAKKCGIKQPALARIETFKVSPTLSMLIKITKCVGLNLCLLNSEDLCIYKYSNSYTNEVTNFRIRYSENGGINYGC